MRSYETKFEFCISLFTNVLFWEKITSGNGGSLKIVKRRFCVTKIRSFGGVLYESNLEQNVNLSKNLSPLGGVLA